MAQYSTTADRAHHVAAHEEHGQEATGWVGWIAFGSFMMMLLGVIEGIGGLVAIFSDTFFVVGANQILLFSDVQSWGWVHLIMGSVIFLAGMSLLSGAAWARMLTAFLAGLSVVSYMLSISLYPVWSAIAITVGILVIYAVLVHGGELKE